MCVCVRCRRVAFLHFAHARASVLPHIYIIINPYACVAQRQQNLAGPYVYVCISVCFVIRLRTVERSAYAPAERRLWKRAHWKSNKYNMCAICNHIEMRTRA